MVPLAALVAESSYLFDSRPLGPPRLVSELSALADIAVALHLARFGGRPSSGMAELRVQVLNDDIIVTLPGSHYTVTYYKPAKSPQLVAKFISDRDDPRVAMSLSEFLVLAWRLANDKARELGWGWGV